MVNYIKEFLNSLSEEPEIKNSELRGIIKSYLLKHGITIDENKLYCNFKNPLRDIHELSKIYGNIFKIFNVRSITNNITNYPVIITLNENYKPFKVIEYMIWDNEHVNFRDYDAYGRIIAYHYKYNSIKVYYDGNTNLIEYVIIKEGDKETKIHKSEILTKLKDAFKFNIFIDTQKILKEYNYYRTKISYTYRTYFKKRD